MTAAPILDRLAGDDSARLDGLDIRKALAELNSLYGASPILGALAARIECDKDGWTAVHEAGGYRRTERLTDRWGRGFSTAEDAILALKRQVDEWRAEAQAEIKAENDAAMAARERQGASNRREAAE